MGSNEFRALTAWEGRGADEWQREWNAGRVLFFDVVDSTNNLAAQLAAEGAPHLTVIVADQQTKGRGRGGSVWMAAPAASLLFSVIFRTPHDSTPGCAPIRAGLAVATSIGGARVKWPNDVVIPGHGKVAGILCEGVFGSHIIAGIGINVLQGREDFPVELRGRATSVASATAVSVERAPLLTTILRSLSQMAERMAKQLSPEEIGLYAELDVLRDQAVICDAGNGDVMTGIARGVASDGALLLDAAGTLERVYNGTVRLADDNAYPGTT